MRLRLALLLPQPAGPSCEAGAALVFEPARCASAGAEASGCSSARTSFGSYRRTSCAGSCASTGTLPSDPTAEVAMRELPLQNTLLASAVSVPFAAGFWLCARKHGYQAHLPT
jgi:hypothetical protein